MAKSESQDFYNGLIANVGGKQKFLEFMDGMVLPYEQHYGMLQGYIGNKYAPNSGIRTVISEYDDNNRTTGTGCVLLPTYLFREMGHICLRNSEETLLTGQMPKLIDQQNRFVHSAATLLSETKTAIASALSGGDKPLPLIGKAVKLAQYRLLGLQEDGKTRRDDGFSRIQVEKGVDFSYKQERVHTTRIAANGKCHCCTAEIQRRSFIGDSKSRLPWQIKIVSFDARPVKGPTGSDSYDPSTISNREEHSFRLNDQDMFRCCYAVEHFVEQWERANLDSFIRGMNETARRRDEFLMSRSVDGRYSY